MNDMPADENDEEKPEISRPQQTGNPDKDPLAGNDPEAGIDPAVFGGRQLKNKKPSTLDEEIENAVSKNNATEAKKQRRNKHLKHGSIGAVILFLCYGVYYLFAPFEGTMAYGICKVFLELNVRYPTTLRVNSVEETGTSVRIWYTQTDSFGEYRMEPIQCYYKPDERYGFILDKVTVQRRDVAPEKIEAFNRSLPVILQYPPDLTLPNPLPDSLRDLQLETDSFRKPIL